MGIVQIKKTSGTVNALMNVAYTNLLLARGVFADYCSGVKFSPQIKGKVLVSLDTLKNDLAEVGLNITQRMNIHKDLSREMLAPQRLVLRSEKSFTFAISFFKSSGSSFEVRVSNMLKYMDESISSMHEAAILLEQDERIHRACGPEEK